MFLIRGGYLDEVRALSLVFNEELKEAFCFSLGRVFKIKKNEG
jgi:hypothetical protein